MAKAVSQGALEFGGFIMGIYVLKGAIYVINRLWRGWDTVYSRPPGEYAKPSDQVLEETCTRHALGKAIVDGFMRGIFSLEIHDFDQREIIEALINTQNP